MPLCFIAETCGGPGEAGGLASGAELIECDLRLRVFEFGLLEIASCIRKVDLDRKGLS